MYYQVEGTNLRVLGSMHRFTVNEPIPKWAEGAFNWAEFLVFEHNQKIFLDSGVHLYPDGDLKEWMAVSGFNDGSSPFDGVEEQFSKLNESANKPVIFLENPQELADCAETVPIKEYREEILFCIANKVSLSKESHECYRAWRSGALDVLESRLKIDRTWGNPVIRNALFYTRNRLWMRVIKGLFTGHKKGLVTVGAGHLLGEQGLKNLMSAEHRQLIPLLPQS